jgi:hypothetical protein
MDVENSPCTYRVGSDGMHGSHSPSHAREACSPDTSVWLTPRSLTRRQIAARAGVPTATVAPRWYATTK